MIGTQIEFKNLSKTFPSRKKGAENVVALSDINLTVEPGEIIGIIGYSGAGKSTLVRMINGLDTPTSGEVLLDGTNIVGMKEKELRTVRRNIGMIFQQLAKNSASALPAHSPAIPPSCLPTKLRPPLTRKPRMKSSTSCGKSTRT